MNPELTVATARPRLAQALIEQLHDAGYACVHAEDGPVLLWDAGSLPPEAAPKHAAILTFPVRLSALLARVEKLATRPTDLTLSAEWALHPKERALKHGSGQEIALTEKESALLAELLKADTRSRTRAELLEQVWGYGEGISTHTLETHVYRLRAKLEEATGQEWITATENGYKVAP